MLPPGDPNTPRDLWTMLYEQPLVARPVFQINPSSGAASLSGEPIDAPDGVDESWLSSGRPIVFSVTLSGDAWLASVGEQDFGLGATTALLNGIRAGSTSTTGFNNVIAPRLTHSNLRRVSDSVVTVTIDRFYDFDISEPETVQVVVPGAAVRSTVAVVATPTFALVPTFASVSLSGELASGSSEAAIAAGLEPRLRVRLQSDTWVQTLGRDHRPDGPTAQLLKGLVSAQQEPYGWNAVVRQSLTASSVKYVSANEIVITVPATPAYAITAVSSPALEDRIPLALYAPSPALASITPPTHPHFAPPTHPPTTTHITHPPTTYSPTHRCGPPLRNPPLRFTALPGAS